MAVEQSILKSTKKKLGLNDDYDDFDQDVIDYVNSSLHRLQQLGVGPPGGFAIEDDTDTWDEYNETDLDVGMLNSVKTYVALKTRLLFDPPGTSYHIKAIEDQIEELEHTLCTERDVAKWNQR